MPAPSTLAVRSALVDRADDEKLVVLTPLREDDLGTGLLAHAVRQRVWTLDPWDTVRAMFGVTDRGLDSALVRDGEDVARALVTQAPPGGWDVQRTGVLTRDAAYQALVRQVLLLEPHQMDLAGLLDWAVGERFGLSLHEADDTLAGLLSAWLAQTVGQGAEPVLTLCRRGHGSDAVALGLALGALSRSSSPEAGRATGALEQRLLDDRVEADDLARWHDAARGWVERALHTSRPGWRIALDRADELLDSVDAAGLASGSDLLLSGYRARLARVGDALGAATSSRSKRRRAELETTFAALEDHRLARAPGWSADAESAAAGVRLARWLATRPAPPETLGDALEWQVREGGWVDRARQLAWNGASEPALAAGLRAAFDAATKARLAIDRAAAAQLAAAVADDQRPGRLVPVEQAMQRVVLPLAEARPTLLLVLDGMSAAVAAELAGHVTALGWVEVVPADTEERVGLLAGLPTVTEVSRTSMLAGRLTRGGQREERDGVAALTGGRGAVFHAGTLAGGAGALLPPEVGEAVTDLSRPLVACVLNAVDDALDGGDPARTRWTVDAVRHLRPLLEQASLSGTCCRADQRPRARGRPSRRRRDPVAQRRWRALAARRGREATEGRGAAVGSTGAARRRHRRRGSRRDAALPAAARGLPRRRRPGRAGDSGGDARQARGRGAGRLGRGAGPGTGLVVAAVGRAPS